MNKVPTVKPKLMIFSQRRIFCLSRTLKIGISGSDRITGIEKRVKHNDISPAKAHLCPKNKTTNRSPPITKKELTAIAIKKHTFTVLLETLATLSLFSTTTAKSLK